MSMIWRDLAHAFRALRKSPGFGAMVIGILALGIGANTAIFSVVNAVILRPLPYRSPDRLVLLPAAHRPNEQGTEVAPATFLDWRRENRSFAQMGAYGPASVNLTGTGSPERLQAAVVSPDVLSALGTKPLLGRLFLPEEEGPQTRVALLSYGLWSSRFGSDPGIVGKVIRLSDFEYPIVGVMPPEFRFPKFGTSDVRLWMPLRITPERSRDRQERWLYAVGRLKDGLSLAAAQQEMDALTRALALQYPEFDKDWGVRLVPLRDALVGRVRPALLILMATVLMVLVIACANVANLQLARAAGRSREMAIRCAIGASGRDVVRQLLAEGLTLALLGGLLGIALSQVCLRLLVAWASTYIPRLEEVGMDGRVFVFALTVSILTGVLFGLVPARSALKVDLVGGLQEGGRGTSSGVVHIRFRRMLTIAELAGAVVLLVGAALLLSSLARLHRVEPGLDPRGVLTMEVVLPSVRYPDKAARSVFFRELVARASRVPGVEAAGGAVDLPFSGSSSTQGFFIEGRAPAHPGDMPEEGYRTVTPSYFETLRIPLLRGRGFSERDTAESPGVAVVNKAFVRRYWPSEDPVGKRMFFAGDPARPFEVVGVIGDVRHTRLDVPTVPEIYVCYAQDAPDSMVLAVRSRVDPAALGARLRAEVAGLDPDQPVFNLKTMEGVVEESTSEPRLYTTLLGVFAALALVLSVLGVYSIISYSVAQRGHEFAIRVALGARRGDVLRLVAGEGMALAGIGILAGLAAAWVGTRGLASLLFGVRPDDPLIFGATAALLASVALAASLVPALRASRANPASAFRAQ